MDDNRTLHLKSLNTLLKDVIAISVRRADDLKKQMVRLECIQQELQYVITREYELS
jgi:hypothetical protein